MLCFGSLGLGVAHFYTMELDFRCACAAIGTRTLSLTLTPTRTLRWILQVRPYALLPFPLTLLAFASYMVMG